MRSDRRFGANETVALELAGAVRRYAAGLARTLQLGTMPSKVKDTSKAVLEGMGAVLATVMPGVSAEDVEARWRQVIRRYGLNKASYIGYSIGVAYPPDWGELTMSLRPGDKTILKSRNVLHSILGIQDHNRAMTSIHFRFATVCRRAAGRHGFPKPVVALIEVRFAHLLPQQCLASPIPEVHS
jgi:Xaa-Pro aminopeptidase